MSDPDVLLLDDPLAAVDPKVRDLLFGAVKRMQDKARVLVTHHSGYASYADKVLVLGEGGRPVAYGTPEECKEVRSVRVRPRFGSPLSLSRRPLTLPPSRPASLAAL